MNPFQAMEARKPFFTPNDLLIYEAISVNPERVIHMTTSALAEMCGVSQPALSRFIKNLGYCRYQDFRAELISCLAKKNEQEAQGSGHLRYFNTLYQVLSEAEQLLTAEFMQDVLAYLNKFDKIFATGVGKSYHPAQLLQILSYKTGRNIQAIPQDMLTEASEYLCGKDLLVIFSAAGVSHIEREVGRIGGKILLVTANPNHKLRDQADRMIVLPYMPPDPESSSVSPVLFDIFVELLVSFMS